MADEVVDNSTSTQAASEANLATAVEICRQLMSSLDLEEVLAQLAHFAQTSIGVDLVTISLFENNLLIGARQSGVNASGNCSTSLSPYFTGRGLAGKAYQTRQICYTPDYFNDQSFEHDPEIDQETSLLNIKASLVAPIFLNQTVIALIWACQQQTYQWTKADIERAEQVSQLATLALQNAYSHFQLARSNRELASRTQEFEALHEFNRRLRGPTQLKETLERALSLAIEAVEADGGALYLVSAANPQELRLAAGFKMAVEKSRKYRAFNTELETPAWSNTFKVGEGFTGRAAQSSRTILVEDLALLLQVSPDSTDPRYSKWNSGIFTPLVAEGKLIGVLSLIAMTLQHFTPEQVRFVEMIAQQVATALHQVSRLEVEQEQEQLRAVLALARTVAHELNQPLTVLQAELDLSLELGEMPSPQTLAQFQDAITQITRLVRDYQKIARVRLTEAVPGIAVIDRQEAGRV